MLTGIAAREARQPYPTPRLHYLKLGAAREDQAIDEVRKMLRPYGANDWATRDPSREIRNIWDFLKSSLSLTVSARKCISGAVGESDCASA